jgi:uncharacterized protein (DUF427 family)
MSDQPDHKQRPDLKPHQESVWDYPRPPRVEPVTRRVRVMFNGVTIADSTRSFRVLETSHPPVYYIPRDDIRMEYLQAIPRQTFCEFKGAASYWTVRVGDKVAAEGGWSYESPDARYSAIKGHIAFYASRMEACYVDDEQVQAQAGDFYGGWITSEIVGPFKGGPGTWGW